MERITGVDELLDGALDDPATLAGNLRDLRRMNRWLGGVALSDGARIEALAAHRTDSTVLDVGTGGADIPLALIARAVRPRPEPPDRRPRQPAGGAGGGRRSRTRRSGRRGA